MKTREQMKKEAVSALKTIGSWEPYTQAFEKNNVVTMYESFGGYYIKPETEIAKKIKEVENQYNGLVYAVIHNMTTIGEMYSLLWISQYDEEVITEADGRKHYAFAYVWNKDEDMYSEFGDILVEPMFGGLIRVG